MARIRTFALAGLGLLVLAFFLVLPALPVSSGAADSGPAAAPSPLPAVSAPSASPAAPQSAPAAYRAVWVSYLEWQDVDFSSAAAFSADCAAMLDRIAALGANVVLAQVRPFGDALYPSALFPFSHLCTGVQGQDPGFDPLAILVEQAHARGLELEAWVNPYRLRAGGVPGQLCAQSPALAHPDWVKTTDNGLYLDPASAEVRQWIADGLAELCEQYAIDGVHFDDYFYPTTDPAFDAADYTASGSALPLADWRRQNVNALVRLCFETVHRYGRRFGIAPQGDPDLNYAAQYSDTALWLAEPGYVDYLMPQLYWGLDCTDRTHALDVLADRWLALPRQQGTALCFGLGAYRIGQDEEWSGGGALASQLRWLAGRGVEGAALYRYGSLFENAAFPALAAAEVQAVRAVWRTG